MYQQEYEQPPLQNPSGQFAEVQLDQEQQMNVNPQQKNDLLEQSKLGFTRKVYGILSAQLLVTALICGLSTYFRSFAIWQFNHPYLFIIYVLTTFVLEISFICSKSLSRTVPKNYYCLGIFTLAMALLVGQSLSFMVIRQGEDGIYVIDSEIQKIILLAAILTTVTAVSLTIYSYSQSEKITIPGCIGAILLGQLISAIFSIIFFGNIGIFYVTFCILGALLAGFYFVYHTMLVRGVFNVKIDNDDYILAAMLLYVDLIELFLRILRLLIIIYKLKKK